MPNKETQEKRQHSTTWIPYSHYECHMPEAYMNVPMHWHGEFELIYVRQGRGEFWCGGRRWEAKAGELLLVPPNMLHAAYPGEGEELLYDALVFSPVFWGQAAATAVPMSVFVPSSKDMRSSMSVFVRKMKPTGSLRRWRSRFLSACRKTAPGWICS